MHDRLIEELNEFMNLLVDDGCYDHASRLVDILEEHDLLAQDTSDWYAEDQDG